MTTQNEYITYKRLASTLAEDLRQKLAASEARVAELEARLNPPTGMEYWTACSVAGCLPYQDFLPADYGAEAIATTEGLEKPWHVLSRKLWDIQNVAENPTPLGGDGSDGTCETPDGQYDLNNGDKARQWWPRLTPVEQTALVKAWEKEGDRWGI